MHRSGAQLRPLHYQLDSTVQPFDPSISSWRRVGQDAGRRLTIHACTNDRQLVAMRFAVPHVRHFGVLPLLIVKALT